MTNKELQAKVTKLEERIVELETIIKNQKSTSRTNVVDTKKAPAKKTHVVIGNLIFDGKYVKTGTGFMSSKTRYAIGQSITKDFNECGFTVTTTSVKNKHSIFIGSAS